MSAPSNKPTQTATTSAVPDVSMENPEEAPWDMETSKRIILTNPDETEKTVQENVWQQINQLPEDARNQLYEAVNNGTVAKHPLFLKIVQHVRDELRRTSTSAGSSASATA